jgi:hypothetical protein
MPPRDALLVVVAREREWPHARVSIKDVFASERCYRDYAIGFAQQIVDLMAVDPEAIEIARVANVGRSDQVLPGPGNDEERPAVSFSFDIDCGVRRAGERSYDDVAALRAAD